MKPIADTTMDELEGVALLGCAAIRAALCYQGENHSFMAKGKLGATAVTNYTRARSSESNRMAVELMAARQTRQLTENVD